MNLGFRALRKASRWTPSVVLLWVIFQLPAYAQFCGTEKIDARVAVTFVYDGDTVQLSDGRKVRFIGINTPERGKDGQPDEPYYAQARDYLIQQLKIHNQQLQLKYGQQTQDRYGRLLAHPFIGQGENLTQHLLAQGLGYTVAIPPNLAFIDCYKNAEQLAQQQRRGIWSHAVAKPISAAALQTSDLGFHRVQGKVERIGKSSHAYWLNLTPTFALRIKKEDLKYFTQYQPNELLHKRLIVQGWITQRNNQLRMTVRHPAAITVLNAD